MSEETKRRFVLEYKKECFDLEFPDGTVRAAEIREFDGQTRDKYLNDVSKRVVRDEKNNAKAMRDYTGMYSRLLSFVLYVESESGNGEMKRLTEEQIQRFPTSVQKALNDIAAEVCDLRNTEDDDSLSDDSLKND